MFSTFYTCYIITSVHVISIRLIDACTAVSSHRIKGHLDIPDEWLSIFNLTRGSEAVEVFFTSLLVYFVIKMNVTFFKIILTK